MLLRTKALQVDAWEIPPAGTPNYPATYPTWLQEARLNGRAREYADGRYYVMHEGGDQEGEAGQVIVRDIDGTLFVCTKEYIAAAYEVSA